MSAAEQTLATSTSEFFTTGGTLQQQAPSYVVRAADEQLYEGLTAGEFCYVLTSRQMGKSSLMIRTAQRLRAAGINVATIDLTAIGQNLTPEQWYYGLLGHLTRQLGERAAVRAAWQAQMDTSPLQRWLNLVEEILLPASTQPLVIFIDEIDIVRSLPFTTDEFFAGLRQLYNARTERPALARLSFCLLGVAAPADLIRDARLTPFNIGRRIELNDFTPREARLLARGLPADEITNQKSLQRILHWTGGHPYLSQRLCRALVEQAATTSTDKLGETIDESQASHWGKTAAPTPEQNVDRLCEELFFNYAARDRDDNLIFVRERLLRSTNDSASLLTLYGRVRKGERVHDDDRNQLISALRLAGITRSAEGWLAPRNRIYQRAFDPAWIAEHMPDAELRRQREAYRRGLWRAGLFAASIVLLLAVFAAYAWWQRSQADAQRSEKAALLYAAHMNLLAQDWENNNLARVSELLQRHLPQPSEPDLRGFEWYYLWRLTHQSLLTRDFPQIVSRLQLSRDGQTLALARNDGDNGLLTLLDATTLRERFTRKAHSGFITAVACSPDNRWLATGGSDNVIKLWERTSGKLLMTLTGHKDIVRALAFAPDGTTLASGSSDKTIRFWSLITCAETGMIPAHSNWVWAIAYSPDGQHLASASEDQLLKVWNVAQRQLVHTLSGHTASVYSVTYAPTGQWLASGGNDNTVKLWDAQTGLELRTITGHQGAVVRVDFAPDSTSLLSASSDNNVRLWEPGSGQAIALLKGHTERVWDAVFFPALVGSTRQGGPPSWRIASGSQDQSVRLWEVASQAQARVTDKLQFAKAVMAGSYNHVNGQLVLGAGPNLVFCDPVRQQMIGQFTAHQSEVSRVTFTPDGRRFATASHDGTVKLWDSVSKQLLQTFAGHQNRVRDATFSPNGQQLVSASNDHTVRVWDCQTGAELAVLRDHLRGVRGAAFTPNGRWLISGSDDHTIRVYHAKTYQLAQLLNAHTDGITTLALSPDGRWLASGSRDRTVKLWRTDNFTLAATLRGHTGELTALAFTPDSQRLATVSHDRTLRLWDTNTFQELLTSTMQADQLLHVAFAPSGQQLLFSLRNGDVLFWQAAPPGEVTSQQNQILN